MNATGKKLRKGGGLNRYQLHHSQHAVKSPRKRRRMGWARAKKH